MVIVTGGAGFIGSNILKKLNGLGKDDIVVVGNLTKSDKYQFDTCADTTELTRQGFTRDFKSPEDGVAEFVGSIT